MNVSSLPKSAVPAESGLATITQLKKQKALLEKGLLALSQSQETQLTKQTQGASLRLDIQQVQLQIQQLEGKAPKKDSSTPEGTVARASDSAANPPAPGTLNTLA